MSLAWNRARRALRFAAFAFVLVAIGVALLATAIAVVPFPTLGAAPEGTNVRGFFHIHAEASHDGYGTLDQAVGVARSLGGRFVVLTEHNALRPERPRYQDGVLVVPGIEISSAHGHVIAVGLDRDPEERGPGVLQAIRRSGGEAILAHPVNLRRPWSDPSPEGFIGFEAISLDSAFREAVANGWHRLALAGVALIGDRRKAGAILMERPAGALERYDEIARRQAPLAMLCGVDAHGLPPYVTSFAALALHVEPGAGPLARWGRDADADAAALVSALRAGRTFCSVPALGDAGAFSLQATDEEVAASVERPDSTLILFRDGVEAARGKGPRIAVPALPGLWRAEVHVDAGFPYGEERLWIASSATRVLDGPAAPRQPIDAPARADRGESAPRGID